VRIGAGEPLRQHCAVDRGTSVVAGIVSTALLLRVATMRAMDREATVPTAARL